MAFVPRFLSALILVAATFAHGQTTTFRQWIGGLEAGGSIQKHSRGPAGETLESREWTHLERLGTVIEQKLVETAVKGPDGALTFTWTLSLSQEPLEGAASWSPKAPRELRVTFKDGPGRTVALPEGTLIWPGDEEERLRAAARKGIAVKLSSYSLPAQQWTALDLTPVGPEPLPGFADAFHFNGKATEGSLATAVELWVSPSQGRLRQRSTLGGIAILSQRVDLPPPSAAGAEAGLFERTLKTLPPHPFLLWLPALQVRWTGKGVQDLPEDPQQTRAGDNRYALVRAAEPQGRDAESLPVAGKPSPADAPFLAPTPLAQFRDPVFDGLMQRLRPVPGASRWELAKQVNSFVYDWIKDKNYAVGFASAQEVARNGKGDCTEHGVLAVALLRRLGIPARGVTGWVAFGEVLGLHFWVEARIGAQWLPLDPTFDQAPASSYRLKLGTTDLADLGSVGWESAATTFLEGSWVPSGPWATELRIQGDTAMVTDGRQLRLPGARWRYSEGTLNLLWEGSHAVSAVPRPAPAQTAGGKRLQGSRSGRSGWWSPREQLLIIDLGCGRWLQVTALGEAQAFRLLEVLDEAPQPAKAA